MALTTAWIDDPTAFRDLAGEWDRLLPENAAPFDQFAWCDVWWSAFGEPGKLVVCTVRRDGKLAAVLPLRKERRGLADLVNYHSGPARPLAADQEAMDALIAAVLDRASPELAMYLLVADGSARADLERVARGRGSLVAVESGPISPLVATDGDFEAWMKGSKAKWKSRIARYRRKMERDHEATVEIGVDPDDLDAWLDAGFALEASGWKGEARTAILSSPQTAKNYRELAHRFHERGELRLSRIVLDGELVAFSLCILGGDRLYSLKVGYDETRKKIVPGLVLQLAIIEWCFAQRLAAYELLGEQSDWKEKVATDTRAHIDLRIYPHSSLVGRTRHLYRLRLRPVLRETYRRAPRRSD